VIATCSGQDADFVKGLGAAEVIDYHKEKFEDRVHEVDLVFDLVAGETQDRSFAVIRQGGVLVSTLKEPDEARAAERNIRTAHYMAAPNGAQLAEIGRLIDAGKVVPNIDGVFPLNAAADAEKELETSHVRGKIVLSVESGG
jgi:NADPH:quinone reductase-like Zn-dependent oxidoreductase